MPASVLIIADVVLALGITARLTRLVVVDSLGGRWFRWPAQRWSDRAPTGRRQRRLFWVDGLACPFCVSTWLGIGSFALLGLVWWLGGWELVAWRIVAAGLTASFLLAHLMVAWGDVNDDVGDHIDHDPDHPDAYGAVEDL